MSQSDQDFSTQAITPTLIGQIVDAIRNKAFGSIEIYIQNHRVVQITERTITKIGAATAASKRSFAPQSEHQKKQDSEISPNLNRNQ